ncbi:MAG: nitric-oxide reductase large subunit, partial [Thermodesulfobacteriota bacterium]
VLAITSYAVSNLRKTTGIITHQKQEIFTFWTMSISMLFIALSLTGAGIVQAYLQRMLAIPYMETQSYMTIFYASRLFFGVTFAVGLIVYLYDFFTPGKARSLK